MFSNYPKSLVAVPDFVWSYIKYLHSLWEQESETKSVQKTKTKNKYSAPIQKPWMMMASQYAQRHR
jgi:hypothetical protein